MRVERVILVTHIQTYTHTHTDTHDMKEKKRTNLKHAIRVEVSSLQNT